MISLYQQCCPSSIGVFHLKICFDNPDFFRIPSKNLKPEFFNTVFEFIPIAQYINFHNGKSAGNSEGNEERDRQNSI